METLFEKEKPIYRLSNGRFATKQMAYASQQARENELLRFEIEKYRRMYLAVVKENIKLKRTIDGTNK